MTGDNPQHVTIIRSDGVIEHWHDGHCFMDHPKHPTTPCAEQWLVNGVLHRTDCPAVINPDGSIEYWIEGVRQPDPHMSNLTYTKIFERAAALIENQTETGAPEASISTTIEQAYHDAVGKNSNQVQMDFLKLIYLYSDGLLTIAIKTAQRFEEAYTPGQRRTIYTDIIQKTHDDISTSHKDTTEYYKALAKAKGGNYQAALEFINKQFSRIGIDVLDPAIRHYLEKQSTGVDRFQRRAVDFIASYALWSTQDDFYLLCLNNTTIDIITALKSAVHTAQHIEAIYLNRPDPEIEGIPK